MAFEMRVPITLDTNESNMAEAWAKWRQKLEIYMSAAKRDADEDRTKIAVVLNLIGEEGVKIYNTFKHAKEEKYDTVLAMYESYFQPRKNEIYERFKFYKLSQKSGQPFTEFLTEVKSAAAKCEFKEEANMIRDKLVLEILEDTLRERLMIEPGLTLEKTIEICKTYELRKSQAADMSKHNTCKIDNIKKTDKGQQREKINYERKQYTQYQICTRCGSKHPKLKCPAYGKRCLKCNAMGHYARLCKSKMANRKNPERMKQNCDAINRREESERDEYYIDVINTNNHGVNEWVKQVRIAGHTLEIKLDTGAECNVLSIDKLRELKVDKNKIRKCNIDLISYGKECMRAVGTIILPTEVNGEEVNIKYVITEMDNKPIFGLNTCKVLGLVKRVDQINSVNRGKTKEVVIEENKDVFAGLGKFPGRPYQLKLIEGTIPKAVPMRRIAKAIEQRLKSELTRLESNNVIKKVNEPTEWLQPLVIKEKPNKQLRICLDPKHLNQAIREERFLLPNQQEILSDLAGKEVFSVLDLREGFYQVELDEESSLVCSFATPYGRYRFCRMPFGLKPAAEIFQKKNIEIFGEIEGVKVYIDDLLIASTEEKHEEVLGKVFEAARKAGVTFNKEKFQYKMEEIRILGHWVSKEGIKLDPDRVEAIKRIKIPEDKTSLLRYLGMVKYVSRFIPDLSRISAPLRKLTEGGAVWKWEEEEKRAFENLNKLLSAKPVLTHYDQTKSLTIQTDASKDGLGSVLLQEGRPVAYASRALTKTEKLYAQIEKEMLAITFAVEKFHYWIYGNRVKVNTDHKPLVAISKKELDKIPTRLQRMRCKLIKYDLIVEYIPGKEMYIADTLSRAYINDTKVEEDEEMDYVIHAVLKNLAISEERRTEIATETSKDPVMMKVMEYMGDGWPQILDEEAKKYQKIKDELTVCEGILMFNDAIVVPRVMRKRMLEVLHGGHQGMVKTKMRARAIVYWPGMANEIEDIVARCEVCQPFRKANTRQPMMSHPIPERPWIKVAMDIATYDNKDYLVVVDYRSKWIEVVEMKGKTANDVIVILDELFAIFGLPEEIISDNMPFSSWMFKQYLQELDIKGTTTSPNYPKANGMVERGVAIAKTMLGKSKLSGTRMSELKREYRSTPVPGIGLSPAEMLMGRQIRGRIPSMVNHLNPKRIDEQELGEKLERRQSKQKGYYDRGARWLPQIEEGMSVLEREGKKWRRATVLKEAETPRSFMIKSETGRQLRRNREHLVKLGDGREGQPGYKPDDVPCSQHNLRDRRMLKRPRRYED